MTDKTMPDIKERLEIAYKNFPEINENPKHLFRDAFNAMIEPEVKHKAEMVALCDEVRELMLIHTDADTNDISFVCNQIKQRIQSEGLGDE